MSRNSSITRAAASVPAWIAIILFVGFAAYANSAPSESLTAIVHATVIHPELSADKAVSADSTIIIAGNRIRSVGPHATTRVPAGARIIDARGKWVIPGLVDSHIHFLQSGNLYTRPDVADFNRYVPYAREMERNKARLPDTFKIWLASGVTSVADVGGPLWTFEVREAARASSAAPRVAVAGPLISMVARAQLDLGDPPIVKVSSEDEARALVQRLVPYKPDFIKVWFIHRVGDELAHQEALVKATAESAHAAGVRLAVHAMELVTAKAALRAGADYLVHSVFDEPVDDEFLSLAKSRQILYCPTLFVESGYDYALSNSWQPTEAERRLADPQILASMHDLDHIPKELIPARVAKLMQEQKTPAPPRIAMQNLMKVWNAGIIVVMGTDAGNIGTLHGPSVFREMAVMAQAGLTPIQVLKSATVNAAMTMAMQNDIGVVAAGRLADLVILDADPLLSVDALSKIDRVFKDGREFNPTDLMHSLH